MSKGKQTTPFYQPRTSSKDSSVVINHHGDRAKFYTPTHAKVNGTDYYTKNSIGNALNRAFKAR